MQRRCKLGFHGPDGLRPRLHAQALKVAVRVCPFLIRARFHANWWRNVISKFSGCRVSNLLAGRRILQEPMLNVCVHLLRLMQPIPFKERNRHNVPAHGR